MDVEERDLLRVEEESIVAPLPPPRPVLARARSASRQPDPLAQIRHRRQGSASDSERDPGLRRRLGDMTKKYEALEGKYKALREASVVEAQSNFEKLRKATEQKAKDQDEVIAALKRELAAQSKTNTEVKTLRAKLAAQEAENARLTAESKALSASLQDSRNEIRALTAKLSTARAASEPPAKMPGSAVKVRANQAVATAVAAKSEEVKLLKLKEDLYSDLTGLMIRGIQREADEDTYDCIQTGRNGTLRFYLTVSHQTSAVAGTPGPTSYEDAEFAYTPLFDAMNDQDLLDILPDYLTEEIAFPRSSAAKFYTKVVDCMSRKFEE
ncbi:hypothetical protein EJ06DRAFT_484780 [Trichodelitschia bisporula]|uniref:Monopolin complex subunit Csm1/Pcs1 C-terminal domain-containing protein n=1 Tax=Trichodelitschia bisporula TaxID=703511 RepID=A0A6G1HIB6_9PEZI|nr:hypothetical protein EJ06DRAFT_484780 [Trichodelitschia bisporula]